MCDLNLQINLQSGFTNFTFLAEKLLPFKREPMEYWYMNGGGVCGSN